MPWIEQALLADGVTAEGRVVVTKALLEIAINDQVLTLAVNAGGTGYVVGETFDVVGGTPVVINGVSLVATGRVVAEAGGVVSAVEILSAGAYATLPGVTGIATTNASAAGNDDLTVDLTTQVAQWTLDVSDYTDLLTQFEWLATSIKASNAPTIGGRSQLVSSNDGIRLVVATGYDGGSTWLSQPGAPPTNEFYCALPNQDPQLYVSITERRLNFLVTDGTFKQYGGMGLFIPFTDVEGNYPFPGLCHGNARSVRAFNESYNQSDFSGGRAGLVAPMDMQTGVLGCYQYRDNLSTVWYGISHENNGGADAANAQLWPDQENVNSWEFNHAPVPAGSLASAANMSPWDSNNAISSFSELTWFVTNDPGNELGAQGPAPLGEQSQLHYTNTMHIASNRPSESMLIGLVDGWERVHGRGLQAFDEIQTESGRRYLVFNDTNGTTLYNWVAMEKL